MYVFEFYFVVFFLGLVEKRKEKPRFFAPADLPYKYAFPIRFLQIGLGLF